MKKEIKKTNNDFKKLVTTVGVVVAFLATFYFVAYVLTMEPKTSSNTTDKNQEASDSILFGQITSYAGEYYVLATFEDDINNMLYEEYISQLEAKTEAAKIYELNMSEGFNKAYKASESILDKDLTKLKLSSATLVKVKDGVIIDFFEGKEKIVEEFKKAIK